MGRRGEYSSAVARIGMVNEPMVMARGWCDSGCPLSLETVLNYFNETS